MKIDIKKIVEANLINEHGIKYFSEIIENSLSVSNRSKILSEIAILIIDKFDLFDNKLIAETSADLIIEVDGIFKPAVNLSNIFLIEKPEIADVVRAAVFAKKIALIANNQHITILVVSVLSIIINKSIIR